MISTRAKEQAAEFHSALGGATPTRTLQHLKAEPPTLRLDWATHEAAKFAVTHWHYSATLPMPPLVRCGVWEAGKFIGAVIFSRGASRHLLTKYGLSTTQGCELARVALTKHKAPVSRIVAIAIKMLARKEPGLRLIVSFADSNEGHHGGIYQAGNWIYAGLTASTNDYIGPNGKRYHNRQVTASGRVKQFGKATRVFRTNQCTPVPLGPKYRYLMPLDAAMAKQIASLARPYPKPISATRTELAA